VSEVQRTTGYAPDLFDAHETSSANVKDKDAKVAYLTKIIACVAIDSGEQNPIARPLKIVAGLEPERTNAFLQALATCAAKGDGRDAARRARRGETAAEKNDAGEKQPEAASAELRADRRDSPAGASVPTTSFDPFAGGIDAPRADAAAAGSTRLSPSLDVDAPSKSAKKKAGGATRPLSARRPPPRSKPEPPISPVSAAPTNDALKPDGEKVTNGARGGGAILGEDDASDSSDDDAIVGDGLEGLDEDAGANPWSAARGASGSPGASKAGGALVRDMLAAKREGDASLHARQGTDAVGADAGDGGGGIILGSRRRRKTAAAAEAGGEETETSANVGTHGFSLGADVFMDSDTRDTTNTTNDASNAKGTGTDDASLPGSAGLADLGAARDATQALVRSTNPLGRAMDALAEDAESMRLELRFWRRERAKHARRVKEDRADTAFAEKKEGERNAERTGGAPSAAEEAAAQTEADIERVAEKIQAARLDVAANDATIAKLLAMVVTPS
jgi:TRAF3-interacting protein 1